MQTKRWNPPESTHGSPSRDLPDSRALKVTFERSGYRLSCTPRIVKFADDCVWLRMLFPLTVGSWVGVHGYVEHRGRLCLVQEQAEVVLCCIDADGLFDIRLTRSGNNQVAGA